MPAAANTYTRWARDPIRQQVQWWTVHSGHHPAPGVADDAAARVVRRHVDRARRDRHRRREVHLLPPRCRLARERRRRQLGPRARPEIADVRPGVRCCLVEPHPRQESVHVRTELHPDLDRAWLRRRPRWYRPAPERRVRRLRPDRDHHPRQGVLEIPAVVDGPAQDGHGSGRRRRPGVAPALAPRCRVPGAAAVHRHLDPAHDTAADVRRRPGDDHRRVDRESGTGRRRGDAGDRRNRVGRRRGRNKVRLKGRRLDVHVGQQVDRGLLHREVGRPPVAGAVVFGVEPPGPLIAAGGEHQRPAGVPVERGPVRRAAGPVGAPVVEQEQVCGRDVVRRDAEEARRPEAVVQVHVHLGPDRPGRERRDRPRGEVRDPCVAPEAHPSVGLRHGEVVGEDAVEHEDGAAQRVLGAAAVGGRAEPCVAPGTGPDVRTDGIRLGVVGRLLVADERPVGGSGRIDAALPARLPEDLVAAEEGQVHAGGTCRLDVGALGAGPVLVVAVGHPDAVLLDATAIAVGVHAGVVGHVVAVGLQPADHRVLAVEDPGLGLRYPRAEGAVVADLVRPAHATIPQVEAVAAVVVVGMPGGVRGLEEHRRRAGVVAHHEEDVARAARVSADCPGEVDPGGGAGRNRPRGRDRPVAAVDEAGVVREAGRLGLGQRCRRSHGGDEACTVPLVVAHPVDVEPVGRRIGLDLELGGPAPVHADVGGEPLDAGVALARDIPTARWVAWQAVLGLDRVRWGSAGGTRCQGHAQGQCSDRQREKGPPNGGGYSKSRSVQGIPRKHRHRPGQTWDRTAPECLAKSRDLG